MNIAKKQVAESLSGIICNNFRMVREGWDNRSLAISMTAWYQYNSALIDEYFRQGLITKGAVKRLKAYNEKLFYEGAAI